MHLSATASRIKTILEQRDPAPPLAPAATWRSDLFDELRTASDAEMLAAPPKDDDMAQAVRSGLLLWNDALDTAHALAMSDDVDDDLARQTLDYWHGIMHRREPDYPNSKYWFRRVGVHPAFPSVLAAARAAVAAADSSGDDATALIATADEWDPFAFADLCERHETTDDATNAVLRAVQVAEIATLLDFSVRGAGGVAVER
ncbi:hypothetical protein HN371_07825 [Candidatus Poribacteria bacterium]|mgnify:FL=1|jgi:hypothetical protein|nr:hypothetical protein [Candidatus Poribacteria bacterium]MBT5711410.1 hypothetical protein [Candidatus Poribacteria bacterium]MBT7099173.1 hypothetical protein [Candidatus Poribacteria bacterium]MBT7807990.1 hypothetical protein [Candidatus Poribacteria bacterium]